MSDETMTTITIDHLKPGAEFTILGGMNISPIIKKVRIMWVDESGDAVHYYTAIHHSQPYGSTVHQTSIERFLAIVNESLTSLSRS